MSNGAFPMSSHLSLINAETGTVYDTDATFLDVGILNGTRLILI